MRSTIICVDDEKLLLNMLYQQLESWFGKHYHIEKAQDATSALNILDNCLNYGIDVSVFISDYIMPIMKGDELLTIVKEKTPKTKRIMLTGYSAIDGIVNAINKGGIYRYISKPWDNKDLMLTLLEAIKSYEQDKINYELSKNYENLYLKYEKLYNVGDKNFEGLLQSFSIACDLRNPPKPEHSLRVAHYCEIIGKALKLDDERLKSLVQAAKIHDLGKIAMSDTEIETLMSSVKYSQDYITMRMFQSNFSERMVEEMGFLSEFSNDIKYQFETYDGQGPFRLKGDEIPIGARIIHIANLYDNVSSKMKDASIKESVMRFVSEGKTYLDNYLTSVFVKQLKKEEK